jgi:hypothetical protein
LRITLCIRRRNLSNDFALYHDAATIYPFPQTKVVQKSFCATSLPCECAWPRFDDSTVAISPIKPNSNTALSPLRLRRAILFAVHSASPCLDFHLISPSKSNVDGQGRRGNIGIRRRRYGPKSLERSCFTPLRAVRDTESLGLCLFPEILTSKHNRYEGMTGGGEC